MTIGSEPLCMFCVHQNEEDPTVCEAFPNGIPDDIWNSSFVHIKPFPGDNGIMYEGPIDVEEEAPDLEDIHKCKMLLK